MQNKLKPPLKEAIRFLEKRGYRYAVIGGIALSQWGVIRVTRDVDIKVLVPETDYKRIANEIRQAFPVKGRLDLPQESLIISVVIRGVVVDFLLALPGYEEQIIERAQLRNLDGIKAWVCSAEDLIIQKAVTKRERDWPDIEGLLIEQKGKLDYDYVENWLQQFAEALDQPELLLKYLALRDEINSLS